MKNNSRATPIGGYTIDDLNMLYDTFSHAYHDVHEYEDEVDEWFTNQPPARNLAVLVRATDLIAQGMNFDDSEAAVDEALRQTRKRAKDHNLPPVPPDFPLQGSEPAIKLEDGVAAEAAPSQVTWQPIGQIEESGPPVQIVPVTPRNVVNTLNENPNRPEGPVRTSFLAAYGLLEYAPPWNVSPDCAWYCLSPIHINWIVFGMRPGQAVAIRMVCAPDNPICPGESLVLIKRRTVPPDLARLLGIGLEPGGSEVSLKLADAKQRKKLLHALIHSGENKFTFFKGRGIFSAKRIASKNPQVGPKRPRTSKEGAAAGGI